MLTLKHSTLLLLATSLAFGACSVDDGDSADRQLVGEALADHQSLEQLLDLVPQVLTTADLADSGNTIDGVIPRYVVLSTEAGGIDLGTIDIEDRGQDVRSLTELFAEAPPVQEGLLEQDALLLLSVPADEVDPLCERFRFSHDQAATIEAEGESLVYQATAPGERAHALCLLPQLARGDAAATDLAAENDPQAYGGGTYTVKVKKLKCNDPRDWENWPYNGDESRLRAFYDGYGGGQIWSSNDVESGDQFFPNRYIHFNNNAKLELYDYDSGVWNSNDKLGQEWIYASEACDGDHYGDFDGSGGGHNWNYDLTYRVYGPGCTCQSQEPAIYNYTQVETCAVTSSTIDSYTYYCSNGIYWKQAWGDVTRHCQTHQKKYNTSCEMNTYVSQVLLSECDKYQYDVAIGSPVQVGVCPNPDPGGDCPIQLVDTPSYEDQLHAPDDTPEVEPLIQPIEPICPV